MGQQPDRNMWALRTTFVDKDKCNDCLLHYSSLRRDASFALNLKEPKPTKGDFSISPTVGGCELDEGDLS